MIGKFDVLKNLTHAFQAESISGLLHLYPILNSLNQLEADQYLQFDITLVRAPDF